MTMEYDMRNEKDEDGRREMRDGDRERQWE
jgi:hypothetical protein